jgi:SAM-dependent methyltransferase
VGAPERRCYGAAVSGHGTGSDTYEAQAADVNRRYFVDYVQRFEAAHGPGVRVLDYGCGDGALVRMLRALGVEAFGADVFYEGGSYAEAQVNELVQSGILRKIEDDGRTPFADGFFDLVVSNQVFEHVEDLRLVLDELDRILKPDGTMLHHFPSREVIREGHIGIPLAHRLPRGPFRNLYTRALRTVGIGSFKQGESPAEWTREKLKWIDAYCFYRPYADIRSVFLERHAMRHREIDYCRFRAADRPILRRLLAIERLRGLYERTFRRLAFMSIELCRSAGSAVASTASTGRLSAEKAQDQSVAEQPRQGVGLN